MTDEMNNKELTPGTVLSNKYELIKQVSRSGRGVVWQAKDRVADRLVALKFLSSESRQNESEIGRIREMFKQVHAVQHPSICALYGLEDGGHLGNYLVMRYLEGETLASYAERNDQYRKGLPLSNVIRILAWAAGALDHAHRSGVIHGNIDPSNIFLAKTDRGGEVVLIGFAGAGARSYMAPEQWQGQKPTALSDQYSLGVVAYKLLAGHPPFEGTDLGILENAVLNHRPEPITLLTDGVNAVLQRALAKHESDRYGSCEEFITDLKSGTPALLDTSGYHISESVSRPAAERGLVFVHRDTSRRWLIVISVLLVFILGAIVWGLNGRSKTLSDTNSVQRQDTDNPFEDPTASKTDKIEQKPQAQPNGNNAAPAGYSQHDWNKIKTAKASNGLRDNQVTWTEVGGLKRLTRIDAAGSENQRGNLRGVLDLSGCVALDSLEVQYNDLTGLNVAGCMALTKLCCFVNKLTSLDVSSNTALKDLFLQFNPIATLDVLNNPDLHVLDCSGNQLTSLDLSKNMVLERLWCNWNQLTSLDVSKNMKLTELYCGNNQTVQAARARAVQVDCRFCKSGRTRP